MNKKKDIFKGISIEHGWLPLIGALLESSNYAMLISRGDDRVYSMCMALSHDLLVDMYVDAGMDIKLFNRLFLVFVYVFETVYSDPTLKKSEMSKGEVSLKELFETIKKHWNDNIEKKINKV